MSELRVQLIGEEAELGKVPAADVARLILGVERAMARAASVVLGRPKTTKGRYDDVIRRAVHLRLVAVEAGSVVPVFELPEVADDAEPTLGVDVASLGESALAKVFDAVDPQEQPHPVVATALLEIADELRVGDRYEAVSFKSTRKGRPWRAVCVDRETRSRLRAYVESVPGLPVRPDAVLGVLVEADFEKRSARLRTPTEPAVEVKFTDELDDDIHAALRQRASFRGEVVYDPKTNTARSVVLRKIVRGEQLILGLDSQEYWLERSFDDLARQQGSGQPADVEALYDAEATDEERDAFMAALAELD